MTRAQRLVPVGDPSQVAEARRRLVTMAREIGFDETDAARAGLVATELSTNLLKHAQGGELLFGTFEDPDRAGIEVLALDRGPGIGNLGEALRDGFSTAGSAGEGLGAVKRQSSLVDIVSWPGLGTAVLARVTPRATGRGSADPRPSPWGAVCVPKPGEEACGDSWHAVADEDGITALVVDGLGHGPSAATAAATAVRAFAQNPARPVTELLDTMHAALRPTRGAAGAVMRMRPGKAVSFAGIGNIAGTIVAGDQARRMVSHNGTMGHIAQRIQSFEYPLPSGATVVLHSDGLGTSWSLARYPGLLAAHPSLIAGVLFRDYRRGRDDATVLVVQDSRA